MSSKCLFPLIVLCRNFAHTPEFWYCLNLVDTPSLFEVPWGWDFWYHPNLVGSLKFHGGGNLEIVLTLWRPQVSLKFHGGGTFDIILTLWRLQVSLKFHGGGAFNITSTLWRLQVSLKFPGVGNFDIVLTLWTLRVRLKFHGVGILILSQACGHSESIWSSMGVGLFISS